MELVMWSEWRWLGFRSCFVYSIPPLLLASCGSTFVVGVALWSGRGRRLVAGVSTVAYIRYRRNTFQLISNEHQCAQASRMYNETSVHELQSINPPSPNSPSNQVTPHSQPSHFQHLHGTQTCQAAPPHTSPNPHYSNSYIPARPTVSSPA